MMNPIELSQPIASPGALLNRVPRPVLVYAGLILLLAGIKAMGGSWGASRPATMAQAVGDGLMSVFHDDEGLKNMALIFTKDGVNKAGTVELRNFGVGLGGMFSGQARAGGELYFKNYRHLSGVVLTGGPLDVEVTKADGQTGTAAHYRIQGTVMVNGSEQPVAVRLDFIKPDQSYEVTKMTGDVQLNGTSTTLQP